MQLVALELLRKNLDGLTSGEVLTLVRRRLSDRQLQELEGHVSDFLTCSFLSRPRDKFVFSHRSFIEFLVSDALYPEIIENSPSEFEKAALTEAMLDFLGERQLEVKTLWDWLASTRRMPKEMRDQSYLGGNAVSLLVRQKFNLEDKDLSELNLQHAKLRNANLAHANLSSANLSHAILCGSNLTEANLKGVSLILADLEEAILDDADMSNAVLKQANMRKTSMKGAILNFADLRETVLSESNLSKAKLREIKAMDSRFVGSDLNESDFHAARLNNANFKFAVLTKADLSEAKLLRAVLSSAQLMEAKLFGANLQDANLSYANLRQADLRNASLNAHLFEAVLSGVMFNDGSVVSDATININEALRRGMIDDDFALYIWQYGKEAIAK